jgi:predicted nucleotidyltransferase
LRRRNRSFAAAAFATLRCSVPDSDVDLAVEIEDGHSFSLIRMEEARLLLQDALRRPVDLGEIDSFRPQVRAAFERDRIPIF